MPSFSQKYPEKLYFEGLFEANNDRPPPTKYLPMYFGNVCLRFLPVCEYSLNVFAKCTVYLRYNIEFK